MVTAQALQGLAFDKEGVPITVLCANSARGVKVCRGCRPARPTGRTRQAGRPRQGTPDSAGSHPARGGSSRRSAQSGTAAPHSPWCGCRTRPRTNAADRRAPHTGRLPPPSAHQTTSAFLRTPHDFRPLQQRLREGWCSEEPAHLTSGSVKGHDWLTRPD